MKLKINKKYIWINLLTVYLLFKHALEVNTANGLHVVISYSDESFTIVSIVYIIFAFAIHKKIPLFIRPAFVSWLCLIIIGIISTLIFRIQPLFTDLIDLLACSKFFAFFIAFSIYWENRTDYNWLIRINSIIRIIVIILSILLFINIFIVQLFPIADFRFGINSQQLFFGHPANLADVGLYSFVILLVNQSKNRNNIFFMLFASLIVITTMRDKQIAALTLGWISYIYFYKFNLRSKIFLLVISVLGAFYIGYDSLDLYYGNNSIETARGAMTTTGIDIANQIFPLGYGFGSFGSGASVNPYSQLYYKYNLSQIYGLSPLNLSNLNFANDAFWPVVFGQFGWLGFAVIIYFFLYLIKQCFKIRKNVLILCGALSLVIYIFIATFGTNSIFNDTFMINALLLSYMFTYYQEKI